MLPVYIAVAAALESSLGTFVQDPTVQASIPLAVVVVLIIEQGYYWDDAQQHLGEQLRRLGIAATSGSRSEGGADPRHSLLRRPWRMWRGHLTTAIFGVTCPRD